MKHAKNVGLVGGGLLGLLALSVAGATPAKGVFLFKAQEGGARDDSSLAETFSAALRAAGYEAHDVDAERQAYFCGPAEQCPWTQGRLDAPPPATFPADQQAELAAGLAACRLRVPQWASDSQGAAGCGRQVQEVLWQRFLLKRHAAVYGTLFYGHYHAPELSLHGYQVSDGVGHAAEAKVPPDRAGLAGLIAEFEQSQTPGAHPTSTTLPGAPTPDELLVLGGTFAPGPPIAPPAGCKHTPGLVNFFPMELPLSQSLHHRALVSIGATSGLPLNCTLSGQGAPDKPMIHMDCKTLSGETTQVDVPPQHLDTPAGMNEATVALYSGLFAWTCKQR